MNKIEILHIDERPNWHEAEDLLRSVLAELGASEVRVEVSLLTTPEDAAAVAFAGSPTILIDADDPFPSEGQLPILPAESTSLKRALLVCRA